MYLLQIEQILQFSAVVIFDNQYDEFLFFNCKKIQHTKKNHGPGPPCKSGDITGRGLKDKEVDT